jgi:hypothetical protein
VAVNGRDKARKVRPFVFATNTDLKPRRIGKLFKRKWGIDASYRMINNFLARTTAKLYAVRKLYFYLAILSLTSPLFLTWTKIGDLSFFLDAPMRNSQHSALCPANNWNHSRHYWWFSLIWEKVRRADRQDREYA